MVRYTDTVVDLGVYHQMSKINGEIETIKNSQYDSECEIDDMMFLEWSIENRIARDTIYKKILVKEQVVQELEVMLQRETNNKVIVYINEKITQVKNQLEHLKAESKRLLDEFFGN
jgi:anaerobic ribonucleoside-triphosphate reductase